MSEDWLIEMYNNKIVGAILLDFSAAFDIIDPNLLLRKRMCYGFSNSAISWIQSYQSNRTHRVFFNGSFSNVKDLKCGVPQGSSLGLLLFSICKSMYADDSTIYASQPQLMKSLKTLKSCSLYWNGWPVINWS